MEWWEGHLDWMTSMMESTLSRFSMMESMLVFILIMLLTARVL